MGLRRKVFSVGVVLMVVVSFVGWAVGPTEQHLWDL